MYCSRSMLAAAAALVAFAGAAQAQTVFSGTSQDDGGILPALTAYRTALGTLNPNTPGSFGSGRREINWDGVPDNLSAPNAFPADFFNANTPGRARGTVYSTVGGSFAVSADSDNPTGTPRDFANINPSYETTFEAFSAQRLFTSLTSNVFDVNFFVPGTNTPALTTGFGAVFSDVDLANRTTIEYFDALGNSLLLEAAPNVFEASGSFSFLGVKFDQAIVASVRITMGNTVLGDATDGLRGQEPVDLVVTDDFVYGEPVPVPAPGSIALLGLAGLAAGRRRR